MFLFFLDAVWDESTFSNDDQPKRENDSSTNGDLSKDISSNDVLPKDVSSLEEHSFRLLDDFYSQSEPDDNKDSVLQTFLEMSENQMSEIVASGKPVENVEFYYLPDIEDPQYFSNHEQEVTEVLSFFKDKTDEV